MKFDWYDNKKNWLYRNWNLHVTLHTTRNAAVVNINSFRKLAWCDMS